MDRAAFQIFVGVGVLLNSALYLVGCLVAGLTLGNGWAWRLSLAAIGVTYLSYLAHYAAESYAQAIVWVSIALGLGAGIALLVL